MRKGKMHHPPPRYVVPIADIDLFDDGELWTLHVLEEDLEWLNGRRYIKHNARIVNAEPQAPQSRFTEVCVRKRDLSLLQKKYKHKRGGIR